LPKGFFALMAANVLPGYPACQIFSNFREPDATAFER